MKNKEKNIEENLNFSSDQQRTWKEKENKYIQGQFTLEEIQKVKSTLAQFFIEEGFNDAQIVKFLQKSFKSDYPKVWTKLASCLPQRSVQAVHNLVHRKFNPDNYQGNWTREEEIRLLNLVEENGQKWVMISQELKRTPTNVKDKYKKLVDKVTSERESKWTIGEVFLFLYLIGKNQGLKLFSKKYNEELTNLFGKNWDTKAFDSCVTYIRKRNKMIQHTDYKAMETIYGLANQSEFAKIEVAKINWEFVSKKMETKSVSDLQRFWKGTISYFHIGQYVDEVRLIKDIDEQQPDVEDDIDFSTVLIGSGLSTDQKREKWIFLKKQICGRSDMDLQKILDSLRQQSKQWTNKPSQPSFQPIVQSRNLYEELIKEVRQGYAVQTTQEGYEVFE